MENRYFPQKVKLYAKRTFFLFCIFFVVGIIVSIFGDDANNTPNKVIATTPITTPVFVPTPIPTPKLVEPDIYIQAGEMKIIHLSDEPVLVQVEENPCVYKKIIFGKENREHFLRMTFPYNGKVVYITPNPNEWVNIPHTPKTQKFYASGKGNVQIIADLGPCKWVNSPW